MIFCAGPARPPWLGRVGGGGAGGGGGIWFPHLQKRVKVLNIEKALTMGNVGTPGPTLHLTAEYVNESYGFTLNISKFGNARCRTNTVSFQTE